VKTLLKDIRKEYPRLIALESDTERIKKLIQVNTQAKTIYEALKREADKILDQSPVEYELIGPRLLHISRRCLHRIFTLATLYRLDGDSKYLERAKKELMAVAKFEDWHPPHFLDTAEMTLAFAIGYDWLYNSLTDDERHIIREAIITKGLEPAKEAYEGEKPWKWWVTCDHNWNQVCNGGIALGALAIVDEEPSLCEYINVLVINGENQDPKAEAPIIKFKSEPNHAFAIADLSSAYASVAKRVLRGISIIDRSRIIIQDEIEADDPVNIVWGFHTSSEIKIDGKTAILTQDDTHLAIRIKEPKEAEFRVVSAQPSKPQAQNEGISNLTIPLPKEINTRIVVEIIPYRDKIPSFTEMNIYPLKDYH